MKILETLRRVLTDESVKKGIASLAANLDMVKGLDTIASGVIRTRKEAIRELHNLRLKCLDDLDALIVDRLPRPQVAVAQDLVVPFLKSFWVSRDEVTFTQSVDDFLAQLQMVPIGHRRSQPLPVGTGQFMPIADGRPAFGIVPSPLFESESSFSINLLGVMPAAHGLGLASGMQCFEVYIQIEAACTEAAMERACAEARQVVATLIRCGSQLSTRSGIDDLYADMSNERLSELSMSAEERLQDFAATVGVLCIDGKLCPLFSFIPGCLDAFYAQPPKKDSILRRISTATRLMTQADSQSDHCVELALSVAAVEAMLCRKGADLANMFAENASALLEPDPTYRSSAVRWCKKLYGLRSEVLHGTGFNATRADASNARLLAAAVLKAMIERRDFVGRMGGDVETPEDLLKELFNDKYTPGQLTGVEVSAIAAVWR